MRQFLTKLFNYRLIAAFSFVLLSHTAFTQNIVQGKVSDSQGNALIGANIRVEGTYLGTLTEANGEFLLKDISPNSVLLISYLGYESKKIDLSKNEEELINVVLKESSIWADEIVISGTRAGSKTPVAHSTLDQTEVKRRNVGHDIPYILSMVPSVVATSEAGAGLGYTSLRLRGSDATRVNVTVNGIPLNDSESQGVFWVNMHDFASSVSSVQIQRGVGTSTNGAGAFGGSINFETFSNEIIPYAEVASTVGSFNTFKNSIRFGTGRINNQLSFDVRLSQMTTDGYIDYSFSDHSSYYLSGAYYTGKSVVRANVFSGRERTGISWWGVPEEMMETNRTFNPAGQYTDLFGNKKYYEDQTDNYQQTHYQLLVSREITSKLQANINFHYTAGEGYYEQFKENEMFANYGISPIYIGDTLYEVGAAQLTFPDSTIYSSDLIRQKWLDNDFYGFTYNFKYTSDRFEHTLGGGWNKYDGDHFGNVIWSELNPAIEKDYEWYRNTGVKVDFNTFYKLNFQVNSKLNLFSDLQYRKINYDMNGIDDDLQSLIQNHEYDFFNPKMGLYYSLNQSNSLYASFSVANKEPTRANFKDAKDDLSSMPEAETLYDYEFGYHANYTSMSWNVNFYFMDYDNQLVPTGEKNNVGSAIMTNVKNSYRAGVEVSGVTRINSFLSYATSITYSKNRIKNFVEYSDYYALDWSYDGNLGRELGETDIAYSPELIMNHRIDFTLKGLSLGLVNQFVGEQYYDNTSDENRKLDAYNITNIQCSYLFETEKVKNIELSLYVNNLFDLEYSSNAYGGNWYEASTDGGYNELSWSYYYPQAGVNFLAGLKVKF